MQLGQQQDVLWPTTAQVMMHPGLQEQEQAQQQQLTSPPH
jgi:hypothetical protein